MIQNKQAFRSRALHLAVLLALIAASFNTLAQDKKIDVTVVSGIEGYKIVFNNSECPNQQGAKGCIKTDKGVKNSLKWELDRASVSQGWVLSGLKLNIDALGDPGIRACAIKDFDLDPGTGMATRFQVSNNQGKVKNMNDCDTAYEVNYELYAVIPGTDHQADSDPVIQNGGRR